MRPGLYVLQSYMRAEGIRRAWKEWYLQERLYYYSSTLPSVDVSSGRLVRARLPIDKAVIYVLEAEELYKKNTKPYENECRLYQDCLKVLNSKERQVFNAVVWGDPCDLPKEYRKILFDKAISKLCDYIEKNHLTKEQAI